MVNQLIQWLKSLANSPWYWVFYIITGVSLLITALYFQHSLEELPCVVCIQIRLLISLLVIVSVIGLLGLNNRVLNSLAHLSVIAIAVSFVERCYLLLGTEKGFVFADCGFSLGLPSWFAIEDWLPWLFRIETSCGYTPEILFGITMAEALMLLSVALLLLSTAVFSSIFISLKQRE